MERKPTNPKPPGILFQYRPPTEWALENLSRRVIYFNAPVNFNDPYDCRIAMRPGDWTDDEFAEMIKMLTGECLDKISPAQKKKLLADNKPRFIANFMRGLEAWNEMRKTIGVMCLSAHKDNLLMWSHYGDYGRGVCLAFDTQHFNDDNVQLHRVKYEENLLVADAAQMLRGVGIRWDTFLHKYKDWMYENEWRAFQRKNGEYLYTAKMLKAIYFGTEAEDKTKAHICATVIETYPHAELWQGRLSNTEYKVEFDRIR